MLLSTYNTIFRTFSIDVGFRRGNEITAFYQVRTKKDGVHFNKKIPSPVKGSNLISSKEPLAHGPLLIRRGSPRLLFENDCFLKINGR